MKNQNQKPKRPWTAEDIDRMIHLREVEKQRWIAIDRALDRAMGSSSQKYEALRLGKAPPGNPNEGGGRINLSTRQESERRARKEAENHMSLTAALLGDPPPGFSALDRKRHQVTQ